MKFQYLKWGVVSLLSLTAYSTESLPCFVLTIITALLPSSPPLLTIIPSVLAVLSPLISLSVYPRWLLAPILLTAFLCFLMCRRSPFKQIVGSPYIMPLFLFFLSIVSINENPIVRVSHLLVFYLLLLLHYLQVPNAFNFIVQAVKYVIAVEACCFAVLIYIPGWDSYDGITENKSWWYLLGLSMTVLSANTFLENQSKQEQKHIKSNQKTQIQLPEIHELNHFNSISILPTHLQQSYVRSDEEYPHSNDEGSEAIKTPNRMREQDFFRSFSDAEKKSKFRVRKADSIQLEDMMNGRPSPDTLKKPKKQIVEIKEQTMKHQSQPQHNESLSVLSQSSSQQSQSLNIVLLIPFCLLGLHWCQISIYLYCFLLEFNKKSTPLFLMMFISVSFITFEAYSLTGLMYNAILRGLMVLIVNKNVHGSLIFAQMIKTVWLKFSFVFVLAALFWFSLKTVNIFHLIFIFIVLMFITRVQKPQSNMSYRHENWWYLLIVFDIFLLLRLAFITANSLGYTIQVNFIQSLIQLTGITYRYNQQLQYFNLIPLMIGALVGLQNLTYSSTIYQKKIHSELLGSYKQKFDYLIHVCTIIYYKIIPWLPYALLTFFIIFLDYSLFSSLLLLWLLITISVQIMDRNVISTYKTLYFMWMSYLRLTALQIVLRYVFEFAKFDIIYAILKNIPFFQILVQYQELLGLAIRQASNVYFKTVTKFQLMIGVDFMSIFVAFLVTEYYSILIQAQAINRKEQNQLTDDEKKTKEICNNYINYKLTDLLDLIHFTKLIKAFCWIYAEFFYPFIGLCACLQLTVCAFLYLCLAMKYYLTLNMLYYRTHVQGTLSQQIVSIFKQWRTSPIFRAAQRLYSNLQQCADQINKGKLHSHDRLRLGLLIISILSVILTYFSRIFNTPQINEILNPQTVIYMRWILYVCGCSIECGARAHFSKLMIVLIVIEMKCCRFLSHYHKYMRKMSQQFDAQELVVQKILDPAQKDADGNNSDQEEPAQNRNTIESGFREITVVQEEIDMNENKRYKEMQISIRLGINKVVQRGFVMVLVFASIVQSQHPFGIVYLLCAFLLNYLGAVSIKSLSRVLTIIVLLQYFMILLNYSNKNLFPIPIPQFQQFQEQTLLKKWFNLSTEWQNYFTFGKTTQQIIIMPASFILMALYQLYFQILRINWLSVMKLMENEVSFNAIQKKLYSHVVQMYNYALIYSPLCLTVLCLAIYLLDYTTTNLFLSTLSIFFLFFSFLLGEYSQSRQLWKAYFFILQIMIVFFMIVYELLSIPMYNRFCNPILCSSQQFHTQIYKAILLFVLQIGIDLMNSNHFSHAMEVLKTQKSKISFFRLAISFKNNDRKIKKKFQQIERDSNISASISEVTSFLGKLKQNPSLEYENVRQIYNRTQSWKEMLLQILPSFIDYSLILTPEQAYQYVHQQNKNWIQHQSIAEEDLQKINQSYEEYFENVDSFQEMKKKLDQVEITMNELREMERNRQMQGNIEVNLEQSHDRSSQAMRRSYTLGHLPFQSPDLHNELIAQTIRESQAIHLDSKTQQSIKQTVQTQGLYLQIIESLLSNWHYLTYFVLVLEHVRNLGVLTLPLPIIVFAFGVPSSYQAGKYVWRSLFLLIVLPITFKFAINIGLISLEDGTINMLIGNNYHSIFLEYLAIIFVLAEVVILKIVGLYEETSQEIECMKLALVRNIVNLTPQNQKDRPNLLQLLKESNEIPFTESELIFFRSELKPGYDYSTLMVTLQLILLLYIFFCYDQMAVRKQFTFSEMIKYNQFTAGMVIFTLIQLFFLLAERFISIADFKDYSTKWDISLICKFVMMIITIIFVEFTVLFFFPYSSGIYESNSYIGVYLLLNFFCFLISGLQIKYGIDHQSKGFMDRYTWYNGYVYMGFRAVPFLFQFKVSSDWTFTRTALRLYDYIRLEQIFGKLYVAKCNSLFMQGKVLGSRIEWWKKLLMGYPLLLAIILLLFGPLVLFSSLNPLASYNDVEAGYLQLILKVNKTNEYPFYTNSHITDIQQLDPDGEEIHMLKSYDIDQKSVQIVHLQEYSDQYWQISQGSYYKLLAEPQESMYQLIIRVKFDRNMTGVTPLYNLNSYELDKQEVPKFKKTLLGQDSFTIYDFMNTFIRLDNNNGLHFLGDDKENLTFHAEQSHKANKQYWIIDDGLNLKVASDKYTRAIFGYSVMSFYISIILVIANYFRFLFQGSVHTIIMSDMPNADPLLSLCNGIYQARKNQDMLEEERLFWILVDLMRSPDTLKSLTGDYLQARLRTIGEDGKRYQPERMLKIPEESKKNV